MQELIDKLKTEAGLNDEQAKQAIATIKNYVVEKFPMLEGAVSNIFGAAEFIIKEEINFWADVNAELLYQITNF